jgi:hypothetical protein
VAGAVAALKSEALLNESGGAGYIERNWPPALKDGRSRAYGRAFSTGPYTLVDPGAILKSKIAEFVLDGTVLAQCRPRHRHQPPG